MKQILLNADLGEGEPVELTRELMQHIDLANIACGGHSGTISSMETAISLAVDYDVKIGAHPGLPVDFGRGSVEIDARGLELLVVQQAGAMAQIAGHHGQSLHHIKLHGALYHASESSTTLARGFIGAVARWFPRIKVICLAGGTVAEMAHTVGVEALGEGFAERGYLDARRLVPRGEAGDFISELVEIRRRIVHLRDRSVVESVSGEEFPLRIETICVHADSPDAIEIARTVRGELGRR